MAAPATDGIQKELDHLDKRIVGLKVTYDQYFLGIERLEPIKEREAVHKVIIELGTRFIRNTGAKFRRDSLKAKFLSYARYWDRILKQIEEGTYKGHRVKAELRERERLARAADQKGMETAQGPAAGAPKPAAANGANGARPDPVQRLLDQYVASKRKSNETTEGLSRERMASIITQQTQALKQKYKCKSVEFRVVVEGGKTKLKAIPKS